MGSHAVLPRLRRYAVAEVVKLYPLLSLALGVGLFKEFLGVGAAPPPCSPPCAWHTCWASACWPGRATTRCSNEAGALRGGRAAGSSRPKAAGTLVGARSASLLARARACGSTDFGCASMQEYRGWNRTRVCQHADFRWGPLLEPRGDGDGEHHSTSLCCSFSIRSGICSAYCG